MGRGQALNEVFAKFQLNYHNQYYKAFPTNDVLSHAKKLWYEATKEFDVDTIRRGSDEIIKNNKFLPAVSVMRQACIDIQFNFPAVEHAYREACLAPSPKSAFKWSNIAVYNAGIITGWMFLSTTPEKFALPKFREVYQQTCKKIMAGKPMNIPKRLHKTREEGRALPSEEQRKRLKELREAVGI